MSGSRRGAALVLALVLLIMLDCVLLGTLQLASQQRRIAEHRLERIGLQLAAESAVTRMLAAWPESSPVGNTAGAFAQSYRHGPDVIEVRTQILLHGLALISASAHSSHGTRYDAAMLVLPPALTDSTLFSAALIGGAGVTVRDGAIVRGGPPPGCAYPPGDAIRTSGFLHLGSATLDGPVTAAAPPRLPDLRDHPGAFMRAAGDTVLADPVRGVLVAAGAVTLAQGGRFDGLILSASDIVIESDATMSGTSVAAGRVYIAGAAVRDPCVVRDVIRDARLDVAWPAHRAWIPGFW